MPMIQIMGLSGVLYGVNIIDKKAYTTQHIATFDYPSTEREVQFGGYWKAGWRFRGDEQGHALIQ